MLPRAIAQHRTFNHNSFMFFSSSKFVIIVTLSAHSHAHIHINKEIETYKFIDDARMSHLYDNFIVNEFLLKQKHHSYINNDEGVNIDVWN